MDHTYFSCSNISSVTGNVTVYNGTSSNSSQFLDCNRELRDVCDAPMHSIDLFIALFFFIVMVMGTIGNSLVVLAVAFSRSLRSQVTNYFLTSLAVSDIMVSLLTLPVKFKQALQNQHFCMNEAMCYFYLLGDTVASVASVTHLFIIGIDRFVAITRPYAYPQLVTKERCFVVIVLIWIYSFFWAGLMLFNWEKPEQITVSVRSVGASNFCSNSNTYYYTTLIGVVYFVPLFIMILTYSVILKIAIKQAKAIASLEVGQKHGQRRKRRELKATSTVMVVFMAFIICWLPNCIITITSLWEPEQFRKLRQASLTLFQFIYITFVQLLPAFNSCLNPIIYAICNRYFREAFRSVFLKILNRTGTFADLDRSTAYYERNGRGSVGMTVNFPKL